MVGAGSAFDKRRAFGVGLYMDGRIPSLGTWKQ